MVRFARLLLRRVFIFLLVAGLAFFTVFELFPYMDDRLPWLLAVLLTYCFVAYMGIPAIIRIFRIFDTPNHIPQLSTTGDGWPSDPVNVAILARTKKDFIWAMKKAGWIVSHENKLRHLLREGFAIVFNQPYREAPLSKLYLFGRKQDISFQIPVGRSPRHRHHVRFWQVTHESLLDLRENHEHTSFWQKLFRRFWKRELRLWVGAAIYDSGPVAIRWRNGQITHQVHPDANYERDFIIESLSKAKVIKTVNEVKSGEPYQGKGQAIGMTIISDGFVKVCEVKRQILRPTSRAVQQSIALKQPKKR